MMYGDSQKLSLFCREKVEWCGDYKTVSIYPRSDEQERYAKSGLRGKQVSMSRPAQRNLNDNNSKKHFSLLANGNFKKGDLFVTLSYDTRFLPQTLAEAKKNVANFIERIKYELKKVGKEKLLKWMCVTEFSRPEDKDKKIRIHHHLIINNIVDEDLLEEKWKKKVKNRKKSIKIGITDFKRIQLTEDSGITNLVAYMFKFNRKNRHWTASRNLERPKQRVADKKFRRSKMEKLKNSNDEGLSYFESEYPNYFVKDLYWKVYKYREYEWLQCTFQLIDKESGDHVLVLSNDKKRKDFIQNYKAWPIYEKDMSNSFTYYRYVFDDGSKLTAMEYRTNCMVKYSAIITLTKAGDYYVPVPSSQTEMINHLKVVAGVKR